MADVFYAFRLLSPASCDSTFTCFALALLYLRQALLHLHHILNGSGVLVSILCVLFLYELGESHGFNMPSICR